MVGLSFSLELQAGSNWKQLATGVTDENGRAGDLIPSSGTFQRGTYRLRFDAAAYFRAQGVETVYSEVIITFEVRNPAEHHHVPLLLSPKGYTTYRGS